MTGPTWRSWELKFREIGANWQFFLCASRQFLCALCHFGALEGVQNVLKWACWKSCLVYFLTQLEFLNLVLICPSKSSFSQDCFLCVKKVAERPFLGVF